MKNINVSITKEEFNNFFSKFDKEDLIVYIEKLIANMQKRIVFEIKMLNATMHFTKNNIIF